MSTSHFLCLWLGEFPYAPYLPLTLSEKTELTQGAGRRALCVLGILRVGWRATLASCHRMDLLAIHYRFIHVPFKSWDPKTSQVSYSCFFFLNSDIYFFFFSLFIYLFMAVLGLCFCARAFSSCGKRGPLFIAVRGPPLTIAASLVAEHRLQTRRLSNCGSRA